jgi:hypothetical protein
MTAKQVHAASFTLETVENLSISRTIIQILVRLQSCLCPCPLTFNVTQFEINAEEFKYKECEA